MKTNMKIKLLASSALVMVALGLPSASWGMEKDMELTSNNVCYPCVDISSNIESEIKSDIEHFKSLPEANAVSHTSTSITIDGLKLGIHSTKGFNTEQEEKYRGAARRLIELLNKDGCKGKLCNIINDERLTETNIKGKEYKATAEIFDLLMTGQDETESTPDHTVDINVTLYDNEFSSVIGYTITNGNMWVNEKYLRSMTENQLAGHILHEYLHKVGFTHYHAHATSVPYQFGNAIIKLLDQDYPIPNSTSNNIHYNSTSSNIHHKCAIF